MADGLSYRQWPGGKLLGWKVRGSIHFFRFSNFALSDDLMIGFMLLFAMFKYHRTHGVRIEQKMNDLYHLVKQFLNQSEDF